MGLRCRLKGDQRVAYVPARRASSIDPLATLHREQISTAIFGLLRNPGLGTTKFESRLLAGSERGRVQNAASAHDNWGLFSGFGLSGVRSFAALRLSFPFDFALWPREFRSNGCGDVCGIDLVPPCRACEVGVLLKRFPRVVAGAVQVGNESADNEKTLEVRGGHGLYGSRRDLLVIHGLSAP